MNSQSQTIPQQHVVDPITLEVIRHGIVSITDQIDANITRTAFSPYVYEYKDFAVGLVSAEGELIAQCTGGMPVFVADSVGMAVRDGLSVYGRARLHHGDVVLCNHAAIQGQHLNNTVMYTPIYAGARRESLIGFFAINVHWIDIGGITPRSSDIFMEGLQLRSIKLWSNGEPIQEVYRIIENNTRFPVELLGDIAAQHAGCMLGRDLTQKLADKYGVQTFVNAVKTILDQSEAAARAQIRAIADGDYSYQTFFDNDGESDEPLPIRVKVIIINDEMTIDYSGIAEQVRGCINSGYYGGGRTTARVAFKYLIATNEMANEGTFRPLKLILPEGKILSAHPTAPMGNYSQPFPTVIDAIIKALEPALPERVTGAHFGTFSGVRFRGKRESGAPFDCHDSGHGGWGACATHDGAGPFRTMAHGDTRIIPVELQESMYPYRIVELSLREDSAGAGKFRGGLGFRKRYQILGPCDLQAMFDRVKYPPWGVHGGKEGQSGRITVVKKTGETEIIYKRKGYPLNPGDSIIVETGGGGGYGPPSERARQLIERDVRRGLISAEATAKDYGVRIESPPCGGSTP
ncbi:MAG TPA: hydantoinase B/oxoprolinase family protein [Candidatus Binatia bacterium]|jgi:N-methylhydantoinase B|nr:hydantoinase B/oxoprolinase family protein [Candidatus Binatia bacterium]